MPDYGQIAIQGFQLGLNMRRNLEETAQMIRAREEEDQAKQIWQEKVAAPVEAFSQRTLLLNARREKFEQQIEAKVPINQDEYRELMVEFAKRPAQMIELQQNAATELMRSGIPSLVDRAQKMIGATFEQSAHLDEIRIRGEELQARRESNKHTADFEDRQLSIMESNQKRDDALRDRQEKRLSEGSFADRIQADTASFQARAAGVPLDEINQARAGLGLKPLTDTDDPADVFSDDKERKNYEYLMKLAEKETNPRRKAMYEGEAQAMQKQAQDKLEETIKANQHARNNPSWFKEILFGTKTDEGDVEGGLLGGAASPRGRTSENSADIPAEPGTPSAPRATGRNNVAAPGVAVDRAFDMPSSTDARGRPRGSTAAPRGVAPSTPFAADAVDAIMRPGGERGYYGEGTIGERLTQRAAKRKGAQQQPEDRQASRTASDWIVQHEGRRLKETPAKRSERLRKELASMAGSELQDLSDELKQRPVDDPKIMEEVQAELAKRRKLKNSTLKG